MSQLSKRFDFKNDSGKVLSGRLELPAQRPWAFALFAHCFTCGKNILAATRIAKTLAQQGVATLRFDFTGLGNSEGDFANTNFSSNTQDLQSAYYALEREFEAPKILIGHSLGGAAVLKAASKLPDVQAVVTIGAPSDVQHVSQLFQSDLAKIHAQGEANVQLAGRSFRIKKQFIDDISEVNLLKSLTQLKKAFLIMHSPIDNSVSIDHAANIYSSLKHPKSFISLDNADHLISKAQDAEYIAQVIAAWVNRYIEKNSTVDPIVEENVLVQSRQQHKFTQDIYSKDHHLIADEPKSIKGDNLGMNPYELLLSGLGACTSMTMKMYADRKGINLESVQVELKHEKKYFEDCESCDGEGKKLDHIVKKISLEGDLTQEQIKKLFEIAEKCPVNRTLQSEIIIHSEH